jgi:hypothetical protein
MQSVPIRVGEHALNPSRGVFLGRFWCTSAFVRKVLIITNIYLIIKKYFLFNQFVAAFGKAIEYERS